MVQTYSMSTVYSMTSSTASCVTPKHPTAAFLLPSLTSRHSTHYYTILQDYPHLTTPQAAVASHTPLIHVHRLQILFTRLFQYGLVINPDKCQFGVSTLNFLGHYISSAGITPLEDRVEAICNFLLPQARLPCKSNWNSSTLPSLLSALCRSPPPALPALQRKEHSLNLDTHMSGRIHQKQRGPTNTYSFGIPQSFSIYVNHH